MTTTLTPPFKIQNVQDTRQFEEDGDRWVPIPGSGDPRECDRCGRIHEIHAEVTDFTGQYAVVGIGCMNATTAEARSLFGKATRTARKAAKEAAQEAAQADATVELDAHRATIEAIPFPADRIKRGPANFGSADNMEWRLDDTRVIVSSWADHAERMGCLESHWRRNRLVERIGGTDAYHALCRRAGTYC